MDRKDILIKEQRKQIEQLTEQCHQLMSKNIKLMNALTETERVLSEMEDRYGEEQLTIEFYQE